MTQQIALFWFRRDLRLHDNTGLFKALSSGNNVLPLFIFDRDILTQLPDKKDRRIDLLHQIITELQSKLKQYSSSLLIEYGKPEEIFTKLFAHYSISVVYTNKDYEPYAKERDKKIAQLCAHHHCAFHSYKDQVLFESDEILTKQEKPYTVYTPYSRTWKRVYEQKKQEQVDRSTLLHNLIHRIHKKIPKIEEQEYSSTLLHNLIHLNPQETPNIEDIALQKTEEQYSPYTFPKEIIQNYEKHRDFPAINGTSKSGFHLRFGTVSIREAVTYAHKHNAVWLQELIWRDFFSGILDTFPHVAQSCFKTRYNELNWRNNEEDFKRWCSGQTGYPIVDAGMRELNETGWMHNRVRMITASFLCKHLYIDWRWGEAYFAEKLLDYELASNVGNWHWASGSGVDAAPYFRIFNPMTQIEKFDKQYAYIKKWIPELGTEKYPATMVDHKEARERCLRVYKAALS